MVTINPNDILQTLTVLSSEPDATNSQFGENEMHVIGAVCPSNTIVGSGVFNCKISIILFIAIAENCESCDIAKHETVTEDDVFKFDLVIEENLTGCRLWRLVYATASSFRNEYMVILFPPKKNFNTFLLCIYNL